MTKEHRTKIIEDCLNSHFTKFEANNELFNHNEAELNIDEGECYDIIFSNYKGNSERNRIIIICLWNSYPKAKTNLELIENDYRRMDFQESTKYEEVITKIKFFKERAKDKVFQRKN
jgi:hypothetical protein